MSFLYLFLSMVSQTEGLLNVKPPRGNPNWRWCSSLLHTIGFTLLKFCLGFLHL